MDFNKFMDILGITEEYQIQTRLMQLLLSDKKNDFLDTLISNGFDTSNDELRDIFQNECANRKTLKQDYTPDCVCTLLSKLSGKQTQILDVCCGVGSLSIKCIDDDTSFVMEEVSGMSISMLLLNMSIRNVEADILKKNVLTREVSAHYKLSKSDKYSNIDVIDSNDDIDKKYSCIISNPPYSLSWEPKDDKRFQEFGLAPKGKADYAFILDILHRLDNEGSAFIVLPHGVLFRGANEAKIREQLVRCNVIDAVIGLPANLFFNTAIPTLILVLKKNRQTTDVLFVDASNDFKKVGKTAFMTDEHIQRIVDVYHDRTNIDRFSSVATFNDIANNDFNLNIPRYVDTTEPEPPVDFDALVNEMAAIENIIGDVQNELIDMIDEMVGPSEQMQYNKRFVQFLQNSRNCLSDSMIDIFIFISCNSQRFRKYKYVNLLDLVHIERAKKDKIYPAGSILIQLSATRGQTFYLDKDSKVESKYGVIQVKDDCINSKYLYYVFSDNIGQFLQVYQTDINIVPDVFKYMNMNIHIDRDVQDDFVCLMDFANTLERNQSEYVEVFEQSKAHYLQHMMV